MRQLRKLHLRVTVRHVYTLREHPQFQRQVGRVMQQDGLKVFLLSSPSSFLFLKRRVGMGGLRRGDVRLVAIGPTTRALVRKYGLHCAEAPQQDLKALVRAGTRLR